MTSSRSTRFQKTNRLLDAAAFGRVFKKAKRSRDKFFTVLCRDHRDGPARLGLAISKKHCRKATARNKIKRVVREAFRLHQEELAGLDIVVMNQPAAALASNAEMTSSLLRHFENVRQRSAQQTQDS